MKFNFSYLMRFFKFRILISTILIPLLVSHSIQGDIQCQESDSQQSTTSFENADAGPIVEIKTNVGTWRGVSGNVLIDNKHANSGKQCLQIAGGTSSSFELDVASNQDTNGRLTFVAERWTSRSPFTFRVAKIANGKWIEIYNGDKEVRVGRAFLSKIDVPLRDATIKKLRFTVTSPANTGILIDDLGIVPESPQKITSIQVEPFTLPALIGNDASALVKLKITTAGALNPISINSISTELIGDLTLKNVESMQPYIGGSDFKPQSMKPFGNSRSTQQAASHKFSGKQLLAEGENFVWLGCQLEKNANIDQTISAKITSITFSNGKKHQLQSKPSVQRLGIALRKSGDDKVNTYRIPGLATTNKGTLIGVYDVRHDSGGDLPGNIDVGMSRSTDGGQTWQPMQIIMDMGDDPKWRGDGIGDPTVLVDRKTGTIWVSATWSHGNRSWVGSGPGLKPEETGQWILVKSNDDGKRWSKPINITNQVKKPEWSFLLQGPGKGISMSDGTIVFPAQYQDPPNKNDRTANRLPHSTFIYSGDHGETWKVATGAWDDTTESQVIEVNDGELMVNCRTNRSSHRAVLTTPDMGKTWKEHPTHLKSLIEPRACMASLINVGRELGWRNLNGADHRFFLFSNPDSLRRRNHITVKASKNAGTTWPDQHHLLLDEQNGRGYSCMSMIDSETVGILYEGSQADMTFQRIKIADILSPPRDQKTKNPVVAKSAAALKNNAALRDSSRSKKIDGGKASTPLTFARPFTDHMVLQSDQPIRIWGKASSNSVVKIRFLNSETIASVTADASGNWIAELPAQPTNKRPQSIFATSKGTTIRLVDVLIGEVWFCAGQSNMEWELRKSLGGEEAIANSGDQLLRLHNCRGRAKGNSGRYSKQVAQFLRPETFSDGTWQVDSAKSTAPFSAVGYYFAKRLRKELNVPVGVINVSVGGTPIESWISSKRLKSDPKLAKLFRGNWLDNPLLDQWCKGRAKQNLQRGLSGEFEIPSDENGPNHSFKPSFMFEAGIKPFSPLSVRGFLWYQGESNADNPARTKLYDACFPLLVEDWRESFQNQTLPVAFVQLPAMGRANWPVFREYQRRSLSKLNHVGMAITIDTGHATNVHPPDKLPVGNRLAQWALTTVYDKPGIPMGPLFESKTINKRSLEITFQHVGQELKTRDGKPPLHFEIAGDDGNFHPATATISNSKIRLSSPNVPRPIHARYAWKAFPKPFPNLANSEDLPASPFTTEKIVPE